MKVNCTKSNSEVLSPSWERYFVVGVVTLNLTLDVALYLHRE